MAWENFALGVISSSEWPRFHDVILVPGCSPPCVTAVRLTNQPKAPAAGAGSGRA